jgi:RNA polymerase sigma-70 factor (ECF subfamily)
MDYKPRSTAASNLASKTSIFWRILYESFSSSIPPRKGAKIWRRANTKAERHSRIENLRRIRKVGRKQWKRESNYMTSAPMKLPAKLRHVESPDITTEDLIREIKQEVNVEGNFRQLFERSYARIRRYFQRKGFSPEDSSELTQETLISVFKGLKDFRQEAPFDSWLFSIARNIWRSELGRRKAAKRDVHLMPIEPENQGGSDRRAPPTAPSVDPAPDQLNRMIEKEKLHKLHEAILQLPKQRRRCIELRVLHDLSYGDIVGLMGISIGAVKAHLHEAKKELSERLNPYFDEIEL